MEFLKKVKAFLQGKKTYIIAGLMVAKSLVGVLAGDMTWGAFFNSPDADLLLQALGLGFLRSGVTKLGK